MIILAFDLGSREAGCVVVKDGVLIISHRFKAKSGECARSPRFQFEAWAYAMIGTYSADVVAAKSVFRGKYASAVIGIARLLGLVEALTYRHGAKFLEMRASEAKAWLADKGNASKEEMVMAAKAQFPGHEWNEHTADALGVALAAADKLRLEAMTKGESDG
jgi:Holliday junction resolvasome RuvABC endonuclease subunit